MKVVIYHRADFDGIFCREIARKFLGYQAEYIGWHFGDVPLIERLPAEGPIYILDLPVDRTIFGATFDRIAGPLRDTILKRVVWIDHHKSSIETHPADIAGYRIDGVAACRLTWQWFENQFLPIADQPGLPDKEQFVKRDVIEPYAVQLAGEYDIWDRRNPDAEVFQFGLRSRELTADDWKWLLTVRDADQQGEYELAKTHLAVDTLLSAGHLIRRYQQGVDAETIKRGFTATFEGLTFLVLNTARCNSLTFTEGLRPEHEALMGFYNDGKQWAVTLYHAPGHEQHDLSKIAVKYGGGRHRGACGFRAEVLPFVGEK